MSHGTESREWEWGGLIVMFSYLTHRRQKFEVLSPIQLKICSLAGVH